MKTTLQLLSIFKRIKGKTILKDINIQLGEGEILGLIGPNGAGKSTIMKVIAGLSKPSSGRVIYNFKDLNIGIVPESPAFVPDLSGFNNLRLLSAINSRIGVSKIKESLKTAGLDPEDKKPVSDYSTGMKQRLMIAQAIMESPQLLLFDEPTNGLDPVGIIQLRHLLFDMAKRGHSIIVASHLLHEIELLCHRVAIINRGQIIKKINLKKGSNQGLEICVTSESDWQKLVRLKECQNLKPIPSEDMYRGILHTGMSVNNLLEDILLHEISIEYVKPHTIELEEAFLECWTQGKESKNLI